jgi:hypothetical protein
MLESGEMKMPTGQPMREESGRPYRMEELTQRELEAVGVARLRLRRRPHLRGSPQQRRDAGDNQWQDRFDCRVHSICFLLPAIGALELKTGLAELKILRFPNFGMTRIIPKYRASAFGRPRM